jgi:very-short-patch-repair endonuclease
LSSTAFRLILAEVKRRRQRGRVRDSWFERLLEECSRSPLLPPVSAQHELRDGAGRVVARFDLAFPQVRLAIEAHSRAFHTGSQREAADERRDIQASLAGWDVQYFGYRDATERPEQTRRTIELLVAQRARDLGIILPSERK